jgi:hypothetical protein
VDKYCRAGKTTNDSIVRRMCVAFLGTIDTHSEYAVAFPQWLHERASALRLCMYCLDAFERVV